MCNQLWSPNYYTQHYMILMLHVCTTVTVTVMHDLYRTSDPTYNLPIKAHTCIIQVKTKKTKKAEAAAASADTDDDMIEVTIYRKGLPIRT